MPKHIQPGNEPLDPDNVPTYGQWTLVNQKLAAIKSLIQNGTYGLAALKSLLNIINSKLGSPVNANLSADIAEVMAEVEIIEHHIHPDLSVTTPNGRLRVGALTFNSAANNENVVLGLLGSEITYIFKTVLGAPGANEVHVKTQGSTILSVQKLKNAILGVVDPTNITYGAGVGAHPNFRAAYTGKRISIGTSVHVDAVPTLLFVGKNGDVKTVATLTTTTSAVGVYKLTAITRIYSNRYLLTGNAAALIDRIAGDYQCFIPLNTIVHPTELVPVKYDVGKIIVEGNVDGALIYECDGYYSMDEITFYPLFYGLELSKQPAANGCQTYMVSTKRVPAGAGFYLKCRSNGTLTTDWIDIKLQYHLYPSTI